jgi:hypothetical protein
MDQPWVYVTSEDIRQARAAWEQARDRGDSPERVALLRRDMEQLWRLQAHQFRTEFRQNA